MNITVLLLSASLLASTSLKAAEQCDILPRLASLLSPIETQRLTRMGESYENQILGARFIHQQNPKFHLTPEVERAAALLRDFGVKGINTPEKKIAAWIATLERTHLDKGPVGQEVLKRYYQQRHIITKEEFPDSYFKLQKKIAREQGHGDIEFSSAQREELMRVVMEDQKHSLNPWIEHLTSKEADYPMWSRVWAFEGMGKISKVNAETGEIIRRSASTIGPFVDLNPEALNVAIEEFTKYLQAKAAGKAYTHVDPELQELVKGGNFGKIYGRNVHLLQKDRFNRNVTDGKWVRYPQGSDPKVLSDSLKNCNTGWCTEGASTAEGHLKVGDFYVYYSQDPLGRARNPRLAIRMEGETIGEIRGIAPNQEIDPAMGKTEILPKKLEEFGNEGTKYLKKSSDMKLLTRIDEQNRLGQELTREELRFLYEIDSPINGFGNGKDPRIIALKRGRDPREDMAKIFSVRTDEVSLTAKEAVSGKSKVHYGNLELNDITEGTEKKLPPIIIGSIALPSLKSAKKLVFTKVTGAINLGKLEAVEELLLPATYSGYLSLNSLKSPKGLALPSKFNGWLDLGSLTSAEGLVLPSTFNGDLFLNGLESAKGLNLSPVFDGTLRVDDMATAEGLIFPPGYNGETYFRQMRSSQGLFVPRRLQHKMKLPAGITPTWID